MTVGFDARAVDAEPLRDQVRDPRQSRLLRDIKVGQEILRSTR
jgi:hypothetical protein